MAFGENCREFDRSDSSRPGRSRTFVSRLSAEGSSVELRAVVDRAISSIRLDSSRLLAPGESNPSSLSYKERALPLS